MLVAAGSCLAALSPLDDNSFLTHLATGRLILENGSVPSADPYSFTAAGQDWIVQSWLVSVAYAIGERVGGLVLVRAFGGLIALVLGAVAWRLLRPADGIVARLGLAAMFVAVGAGAWAERPLMVGLVIFALFVLAAEGGLDARWLVPLGWIWANSHGSFPLGLVFLVVVAVGARLDRVSPKPALRCFAFGAAGIALGAVGPLGLRTLTFPVEVLGRRDVLQHVIEWQAPGFTTLGERAFLVQLMVAIVLLTRRPSYRAALVVAVFSAAALLGSRNIAVASIALLPAMAAASVGAGSLRSASRPRLGVAFAGAAIACSALLVALRLDEPALRLTAYPVDALAYLDEVEIDTREVRLAGPEIVGNLMTYVYGADGRVFYDDRFDMYPAVAADAHLALTKARPEVFSELEGLDVSLVLVRWDQPIGLLLTSDVRWRTMFGDERWALFCRRGSDLGEAHSC